MMSKHLETQLVAGLKQLSMNIGLLHRTHVLRGLDITHPYTVNTENALKIAYVDECLRGLKQKATDSQQQTSVRANTKPRRELAEKEQPDAPKDS